MARRLGGVSSGFRLREVIGLLCCEPLCFAVFKRGKRKALRAIVHHLQVKPSRSPHILETVPRGSLVFLRAKEVEKLKQDRTRHSKLLSDVGRLFRDVILLGTPRKEGECLVTCFSKCGWLASNRDTR